MKILYEDSLITLYYGDFREHVKQEPIDLILCDLPYPKEFRDLYVDSLKMAAEHLWLGGSMLIIVPHYLIPWFYQQLPQFKNLKARWLYCMEQESGSHPRMALGIEVCWKPVVHIVRGSYPAGKGFVRDLFYNKQPPSPKDKLHKWQQHESWAEWLISKFTLPGELVCDPTVGSGTSLVVARRLNRRAIGFEKDYDAAMVAVKRLENG